MSETKQPGTDGLAEQTVDALASFCDLSNTDTNSSQEEEATYAYDLTPNWLDVSQDFSEPRYLMQYNGVGFSAIGGVQAITGHKKNGKSWLVTIFMSTVLGSEKFGLLTLRKGENIPTQPTVLYCDTEQEVENTMRIARRVHFEMDWPGKVANPRFRVLRLREDEDAETRWGKVVQAIEEVKPTAVFLDGIRDVIADINDPEASSALITRCMKIASQYQLCFWTVLHYNPGGEKMRGHLGTELGNKVTDTFQVVKEKKEGTVIFKVTQVDARGKDVDDFSFRISDEAVKFGVPVLIGTDDTNLHNNEAERMQALLQPMKRALLEPMSKTKLQMILKTNEGIGSDKAYKWIVEAEDLGIIEKTNQGKYKFKGIQQPENLLPLEPPTDETPF